MIRILLIVLILMAHSFALAQCKIKIDEITYKSSIASKHEFLGRGKGMMNFSYTVSSSFYKLEDTYFLRLEAKFSNINTLKKGEIVYVKFDNDSIMQLIIEETKVTDYSSGEWYVMLWFELKEDQIKIFESTPIKQIRVDYQDYYIKSANKEVIMNQIQCVKSAK